MDAKVNVKEKIVAQATVAFKALKKFQKKSKKNLLFPEQDDSVIVQIKYKKSALEPGPFRRRFALLPHSDKNTSNSTICLILRDLDQSDEAKKDHDVDKQARQWADILREKHGLDGTDIAKIFTFNQLTREYKDIVDKAKLANTYDIFLVDNLLLRKAFYFLGSHFKKPGKMPFPINATSSKLDEEIAKAYNLVNIPLSVLKDSVGVRIGNLGQKVSHLVKNLDAILSKLFEHCPGGEMNVRTCYIQSKTTGASLPVYVDFGSANDVVLERPRKRTYEEMVDECSTLPDGLAVKVRMDGEVTVVDEKTMEEVIYPTMEDEFEAGDHIKPNKLEIDMLVKKKTKEKMKKELKAE